ncbi:hypothetical protein SDRG_05183 [Saprolegnia diclina VS20]|uniref:VTT domain-containing protein n=1 Tax=Saprolegnia diclina (strain VS20) TaxID=1156394 RepID=T0S4G1_SAPDV|nr:hypothetical protein SDRG_05183 [Saprolegnia diclina VS20]EQC37587.1 hypothetical protein SDRG_05183 [Saprolegnia diclina VS20]|eukprot:XP_008609107.1 hypothetical protein SDRG_05183 [Saprolegnia diclina VS20]
MAKKAAKSTPANATKAVPPAADAKSPAVVAYEAELREQRKKLTLFRRPLAVLYHFSIVLVGFLKWFAIYLVQHNVTRFVALPLFLIWLGATKTDGEHQVLLAQFNTYVEFVVWWVGLGVLSSVGLGTGMHSGILFLFPHIFLVVQGAEICQSLDFDTFHHTWFRSFEANCASVPASSSVTFAKIFLKVFLPSMLWGAGTAMGEIPPYALSRAARLAGQRNEEFEEIAESSSEYNVMNRMKDWMIGFLQRHGFWGVLLMSAWPNMAFDLCGICCGHFLMPFWTFFGATLIGKALIKVNMQAAFFITIFTDAHMKQIEQFIGAVTPTSWALDQKVSDFLLECRNKFHAASDSAKLAHETGAEGSSSLISQLGSLVMVAFMGFFAISCIEQFAQQHAAEEDAVKVEAFAKSQ